MASITPQEPVKPVIAGSFDIRGAQRPLPLTAAQEGQVRDIYYKRVRGYCADEIRDFAKCATGRTFTIPIICRSQRLAMNTCMNAHATREEEDKAREEWFEKIPERRQEQEEKERQKEEMRRKHHEWWGRVVLGGRGGVGGGWWIDGQGKGGGGG